MFESADDTVSSPAMSSRNTMSRMSSRRQAVAVDLDGQEAADQIVAGVVGREATVELRVQVVVHAPDDLDAGTPSAPSGVSPLRADGRVLELEEVVDQVVRAGP